VNFSTDALQAGSNAASLLQAKNLSHSYGSFQVLAPLNFSLSAGEISVLEGPNGSGKSTLLLCLSGLLRPTSGEVHVGGFDAYSDDPGAKRLMALVPDVPRFYFELTAWEHLKFIAQAHDAADGFDERAESLMKAFGLWQAKDLLPHHFSRGMSLKLGLLFALVRPFKVLLLDEPTSALDADSRLLLMHKLDELKRDGVAILLSTHNPQLKTGLADHAYRLSDGALTPV
jgi:ABC-2 type transport system ATP-binding protein